MSRSKRRRNKLAKSNIITKPVQKQLPLNQRLKALIIGSWKLIGIIALPIGLIASLLAFASRVSVSPSSPLDPSDPFSTPFFISNDGLFAIYDVKFHCYFKKVKYVEGGGISNIEVLEDTAPISAIEATKPLCTGSAEV